MFFCTCVLCFVSFYCCCHGEIKFTYYYRLLGSVNISIFAADRMLYWSVGGNTAAARYIHRTTLDGAAAADKVQQFVDVSYNSVSTTATAAVQDIVVDIRTRRFAILYSI